MENSCNYSFIRYLHITIRYHRFSIFLRVVQGNPLRCGPIELRSQIHILLKRIAEPVHLFPSKWEISPGSAKYFQRQSTFPSRGGDKTYRNEYIKTNLIFLSFHRSVLTNWFLLYIGTLLYAHKFRVTNDAWWSFRLRHMWDVRDKILYTRPSWFLWN